MEFLYTIWTRRKDVKSTSTTCNSIFFLHQRGIINLTPFLLSFWRWQYPIPKYHTLTRNLRRPHSHRELHDLTEYKAFGAMFSGRYSRTNNQWVEYYARSHILSVFCILHVKTTGTKIQNLSLYITCNVAKLFLDLVFAIRKGR